MKKILLSLVVVGLVLAASTAHAQDHREFHWNGASFQTILGGDVGLSRSLGWRGAVNHLWFPTDNFHFFFAYTGPKIQARSNYTVSPLLGVASGWTSNGEDAFLISLWNEITLMDGRLAIFAEGDGLLSGPQKDYYGYYLVDYFPSVKFNFGANGEQINEAIYLGAHAGFTKGPLHYELQYYWNAGQETKGHSVRVVTNINL